jgi:hypothetical protein
MGTMRVAASFGGGRPRTHVDRHKESHCKRNEGGRGELPNFNSKYFNRGTVE